MFRSNALLLALPFLAAVSMSMSDSRGEYCQFEVFQPSCPTAEAVIITTAKFGRMKLGKCIKKEHGFESLLTNPQYLGCYVDVTKDLNDRCLGRQNCLVKVTDIGMEKKVSCFENLVMYLEVEHKCLPIVQENRQCLVSLSSNNIQHLIEKNSKSEERFCGSLKHPWIVETLKGQTIKVSRLRQTLDQDPSIANKKPLRICSSENSVDGYVYDLEAKNKIAICEESFHYTSKSNQIELTWRSKHEETLLIKLEALGCSDLIPPADAWLKRTENEATIGCYSTRLRWQLKCLGQRWIGVIGNCSYVMDHIPETAKKKHSLNPDNLGHSNQMFTVTVICACGIILCSLIVCIGIICLRRYSNRSKIVESILKEKIVTNGSLMKTSNPQQAPYPHYYDAEVDKVPNGVSQVQGEYFVLDKDETEKPNNLFSN